MRQSIIYFRSTEPMWRILDSDPTTNFLDLFVAFLFILVSVLTTIFLRRFFAFIQGKNPKACTIILRGASKDVLNEVERNLQDAMAVARNVMLDPRLVPGGGKRLNKALQTSP